MVEKIVKCVIVGDCGVGKSSIVRKYTTDSFTNIYSTTIGLDYSKKILDISGEKIKFELWDTAGQERFRSLRNYYYRGAKLIIICYDITDRLTFESLRFWHKEVVSNMDDCAVILLCGTKCDLENKRSVSTFEATEYAKEKNIQYIEVSAKTNCEPLIEFLENFAKKNIDKFQITNEFINVGTELEYKYYCC